MAEIKVKITPEFEKNFMMGFMNDIKQTAAAATGGNKEGGGSGFNFGVSAGGIAKVAGLGALAGGGTMAVVEQLLNQFKPLASTVQQISRLLMEFLRPIADVVRYMLQPVLMILRPLLMIFNQIMAPYRRAAAQIMGESREAFREGDIGKSMQLNFAALQVLTKPFTDVILKLIGEGAKMITDGVGSFIQGFIRFVAAAISELFAYFGADKIAAKIIDLGDRAANGIQDLQDALKEQIDTQVSGLTNVTTRALQTMIRTMGSEVILPGIAGDNDSIAGAFKEGITDMKKQTIDNINDAFAEIVEAIAKAKPSKGGGRAVDLFSSSSFSNPNDVLGNIERAANASGNRTTGIRIGNTFYPSRVPLSQRSSLRTVG